MTDSRRRSLKNTGQTSLTMETSPEMIGQEWNEWISSVEGFPVKTSASLEHVPGWRASRRDYGLSSPVAFANFDQDSSLWKTVQHSLLGDFQPYSETWPVSGMMRNGTAYRQRPSGPHIFELERGFLPTPLASETGYRRTPCAQGGLALSTVIGGPANPEYVEWMMGFPIGWTDLGS